MTSDSRPLSDWTSAWTLGSGVPCVFRVELIREAVSRFISLSWTGAVAVMPVPEPLARVSPIWSMLVTSAFCLLVSAASDAAFLRFVEAAEYAALASPWPSLILSDRADGSARRWVADR